MNLEVKIVSNDPEASNGEMLGITRERFEELIKFIGSAFDNHKNNPIAIIAEVSKEVVHPNELAFISFAIGNWEAKLKNPFYGLVAAITGQS